MPFVYDLSFAGIPFCLDGGTEIPSGDASPTARPYEQRGGILEEVNTIIPFKYLKDFSIPSVYPGRNLGAINYPNEMGPYPNPDVRIGDWYYPPGAKKWSVFRGLATSSMVKAMLAACRNTAYGLRTQASLSVSGFLASGTATLDRSGYFSGYFSDYQSGSVQYPTINAYQYPTWISLAGTIPNLFKILAIPQGAGEKGVPYGVSTFLYMLPPRPLAELGGSFDGLYLVTLVDERYYWQNTPVRLPIQQGMTWNYLLNELAIVLGIILYTNSPIEAVYGKPELDSQLWTCQESAATLLDAVAANVGRTVVRRYDGTYVLYTPEESREVVRVNRGDDPAFFYDLFTFSGNSTDQMTARSTVRTAGGDVFYSGTVLPAGSLWAFKNAVAPFQIVTAFPKYVVGDDPVPHFSNPRYQGQRRSTWYEESYGDTYNVVVPILSGGPYVSGLVGASEMFLHDTAKALFSGEVSLNSGTPLNSSGLTALAMRLAQDFYTQQVGTGLDEVYPGTRRWEPEGVNDLVYSYSDQARGAFTRVMHPSWTQKTVEYQHATPPMSGFTENPPGVGGPSVAQTVRDSYGRSGTFWGLSGTYYAASFPILSGSSTSGFTSGFTSGPISGYVGVVLSGPISGSISTNLSQTLLSGSFTAAFSRVDFFPTQNRWYGKVLPLRDASGVLTYSGDCEEVILFEGTSGGVGGIYSGNYVGVVQRGVQGTFQREHPNQSVVLQVLPDAGYGVNLTTYEPGQFVFPGGNTSGGVGELRVIPQTQTVRVLDAGGISVSGVRYYSGRVQSCDLTVPATSGPWLPTDFVWVVARNTSDSVTLNGTYDGQFVGHSPSATGVVPAPVYAVNAPMGQNLMVLSRLGDSDTNLLKQPLYSGQKYVVLDSVSLLPTNQCWWAYLYPASVSFLSGEILLMAGTSGGLSWADVGLGRVSGYQYFSGGFWSGVIGTSQPTGNPWDFGLFVQVLGRGMFNTQLMSGVVSGTQFRKSQATTQGWSSGVNRMSFTHAAGPPEGSTNSAELDQAQMSFPGAAWSSGLTREQIVVPQFRVVRVADVYGIGTHFSGSILYQGYTCRPTFDSFYNASYPSNGDVVWVQFLDTTQPSPENSLSYRGFDWNGNSGTSRPIVDPGRPYLGMLAGYSAYNLSGSISYSGHSRPVYVVQAPLPETASVRVTSQSVYGTSYVYRGFITLPNPNQAGLSGYPWTIFNSGPSGYDVGIVAVNGQRLEIGCSYNARFTGYLDLFVVDRSTIVVETNGLVWPEVRYIRLNGTSGGAGMFATPLVNNLSGSPDSIELFYHT